MRIVRYADYAITPWRNGRGVLRSIVEGDGWQLRLADIDGSVPFSDYRGQLRHFAIVSGAVVLRFSAGDAIACDPRSAVAVYPGAPAPYCELAGAPALAFNLIVEPDRVNGAIERVRFDRGQVSVTPEEGRFVALLMQAGSASVTADGDRDEHQTAYPLDTVVDLPAAGIRLQARRGEAVALIARIAYRPHGPARSAEAA